MAVVIALLGELHPLGMVVSSFLFAALVVGGNAMERSAAYLCTGGCHQEYYPAGPGPGTFSR